MIKVFVNMEEKIVEVYTETGIQQIEFEEIDTIKNRLGDRDIYYITGLKKTKADEISKLVYNLQGKIFKESKNYNNLEEIGEEIVFLHNATKGVIFIPDIELTLRGGFDILQITGEFKKTLQSSVLAKKLILAGKLKIIGNKDRRSILRKLKKDEAQRQSARDAGLDSILGDRDGDDFISKSSEISTQKVKDHDAEVIEIKDTGGSSKDPSQSMEANLEYLKDLP